MLYRPKERCKARMEQKNAAAFDATGEERAVGVQTLDFFLEVPEAILGPVSFLKSDNSVFWDKTF